MNLRVGLQRCLDGALRHGSESERAHLAVDVGTNRLLQQPDRARHAVVDRGVEVEEGERRRKIVAIGRRPVAGSVDRAGRGGGDALQLLLEGGVWCHALPVGVYAERDAEVGRPARIVRIITETAFHFEEC